MPTRFAKVEVIAGWPEALARLRVCSNPEWRSVDAERAAIQNCGYCRKCVWTLTSLELITGLTRFPSFSRAATRGDLRWAASRNPHRAAENLRQAVARGRRDIAFAIRCGEAQRQLERWLRPIRRRRHGPIRGGGSQAHPGD
jgi:hypothetical protein